MTQPARANHPISNSLNVMGPNPLVYPQNYQPDEEGRPASKEAQQQTDTTNSFESMMGIPGGSNTVKNDGKRMRNIQPFESLLAAVNNKTGK